MKLSDLGWNDHFAQAFEPFAKAGYAPARVICELRHAYALNTGEEEILGECLGKLLHEVGSRAELPAVGDWVVTRRRGDGKRLDIVAVLPRSSKFSRRAAGENGHEQVVACNTDTLFILASLDTKLNLRRLERYLAVARLSGAEPVFVLNKADLHPDPEAAAAELAPIAGDAPILTLSAETGRGCPKMKPYLKKGRTVAFLGPSGAGKSTLVNRLMRDEVQVTQDVRDSDAKGRHTTTRRELFVTPSGALLIDTPGLRELQLWDAGIEDAFADVQEIIGRCRFPFCSHGQEAGCAILAALEDKSLTPQRWESYQKLQLERAEMQAHLDARPDKRSRIVWRKASKVERPKFRPHDQHD